MKVGISLNEIYTIATNFIKEKDETLLPNFVKTIGYSIGFDYDDKYYFINEKNNKKIKNGMCFLIFVGFDNIENKENKKKYSLLLSDTILINEGKSNLLTNADRA
jgi:nucleosome binding factor SPN SPT16 subunit